MNPVKNNGNLNKPSDPYESSGRVCGVGCALGLVWLACYVAVVVLIIYLLMR